MKKHLAKALVIVCAAAFLVSGCNSLLTRSDPPREVKHSADIADVFVTTLPPMAFSELQSSLAIQHGLTPADCRTLAAQTTRSDVYQLLSQVAFGIGVALPLRAVSSAETTSGDVTSLSKTITKGSATVPSSSGASPDAVTDTSLSPDIAKQADSFGLDGEAAIMGGTALCQAAVLTQQQITSAKLPEGYDANIITFQVNVQPKARDLSYDTYIGLELWPVDISAAKGGNPSVLVYPLIINDVLESTSTARSAEIIRQFSASLSGVLGNLAAVNAGGSNSKSEQNTVLGADRNGILTMGRVNSNAIQIRLGAPNSGSTHYAMIPRTFSVSALVLTKESEDGKSTQFTAISRSDFVSTNPDAAKPSDKFTEPLLCKDKEGSECLAMKIADILRIYSEFKLRDSDMCGGRYVDDYNNKEFNEANMRPLWRLLRQVHRQDYEYLGECLELDCDSGCKTLENVARTRLYSDLAKVNGRGSRYSTNIISIPSFKTRLPKPDNQLIIVEDDGKVTTAVLRGGRNLNAKKLTAYAVVNAALCDKVALPIECRVPASNLSVSPDGTVATITLPSLAKLKLSSPEKIVLAFTKQQEELATDCSKKEEVSCFSRMLFPETKADTEVSRKNQMVDLSVATRVIVSDGGAGSIGLRVDIDKALEAEKRLKKGEDSLFPIYLDIGGAKVATANTPIFLTGPKGVTIAQTGTADVVLGNLTPGQLVTVKAMGKGGKELMSDEITLHVERLSPDQKKN